MRSAVFVALAVHVVFLLVAYFRPLPPQRVKKAPIAMKIVARPKPPEPPKPEVTPPTPPKPEPPPPAATPQPKPQASRPLPRELQPVKPSGPSEPQSPAISVPVQPPSPQPEPTGEIPKGPINLFPKSIGSVVGVPGINAAIPKGPDRLLKDERLEEKKAPEFELQPEKGGGYKFEGKNFIAHIKPDGGIEFENRFPIGFQKGGTFSFDITDLAMRGKGQDPYLAEKRRFLSFSEKVRNDLRKKATDAANEDSLARLSQQLRLVWDSGMSASAKRRDIYEKWVDCSDDKADTMGRKGRRIIEDFIRSRMPAGGGDAYTDEELQKIASERQGLPPFDPYRSGLK